VRKSRFSEEQIIAILKESEAGVGTEELCRRHGITLSNSGGSNCQRDQHVNAKTRLARAYACSGGDGHFPIRRTYRELLIAQPIGYSFRIKSNTSAHAERRDTTSGGLLEDGHPGYGEQL